MQKSLSGITAPSGSEWETSTPGWRGNGNNEWSGWKAAVAVAAMARLKKEPQAIRVIVYDILWAAGRAAQPGETLRLFWRRNQGGHLPKIPGGTAIAYMVENALKSPKKP